MNDKTVMPIQPIVDYRFVENKIVRMLLDNGPFDMNDIAGWDVSRQDRIQFAQLIGYSVSGFSDLSYVDDETYEAAERLSESSESESEARLTALREQLDKVREGLKIAVPAVCRIHPDDLDE